MNINEKTIALRNVEIEEKDFKGFVKYLNDFYGVKGVYPNKYGKDLQPRDVLKAIDSVSSKRPKHEWEWDSLDRELVRDELIKMKKFDYPTQEAAIKEISEVGKIYEEEVQDTVDEADIPGKIPSQVKVKLEKAVAQIKDSNLTYPQRLKVLSHVLDSLDIDKKELTKMTTRLKGTLEGVTEGVWSDEQERQVALLDSQFRKYLSAKGIEPTSIEASKAWKKYGFQDKMRKIFGKAKYESVNEDIEPQTKKIASLTGTRPDAVKHFVSKHALNITKLLKFIEKGKLSDRMDFSTALAGKDGNPIQKKIIKMFQESVTEAVKPSQVRSVISKVKKDLMKKWQQKGGYENFGDKEGRVLRDKFNFNPYGSPEERQIAQMIQGFEDWAMNYDGNMREGKKVFSVNPGIGNVKYSISSHDGVKKHKDGSDFFDIKTFKNKVDLEKAIKDYTSKGFKMESVVSEATKYKVGQKTPVGKIVGTSVWGKGSKQAWFYDVQKPGHSPVQYSEESLDKIMGESVNEETYTVIDPKGNSLGTAEKSQVVMAAKKRGGHQAGYFVVSSKNALKARRALEKFKGDFKNPKLKAIMDKLYEGESINEADVVGKTIFSDGKGKLYFGYYKTDDAVEFVDYKTWKKLGFKDVSKGDTNKDRVISAILKNQKQFNKKVDYNMWSKKTNPSFEEKMDWFIKNGWINNINKGGIKE